MSRQNGIILKGYVNHHTEVCPYDNCPIKAYKRLMIKEKLNINLTRKKWSGNGGDSKSIHTENNELLLNQGRSIY
jgi:hypothetical protein